MFRWWDRNDLHRIEAAQLQILRKVNYIMTGFNDLVAGIEKLKEVEARMVDELHKVRVALNECAGKEHIDPEDVKRAHDALVGVIGDMEQKLHSDGM